MIKNSIPRLVWILISLAFLSSCATMAGWVELSRSGATRIFEAPDSIKPHQGGKLSDWEGTFLIEAFPYPEGFRQMRVQVVLSCATSPQVSYSVHLLEGLLSQGNGADRTVRLDHPSDQIRTRLGLASPLAKAYEIICNRPRARESVAEAAKLAAAQEEQRRAAATQAAAAARAEFARRESARIEEIELRARNEAAAKLQRLDEQMRLAEDQLRRGNDYPACVLAKTNADSAKGTDRLASAIKAQEQICAEHTRIAARRQEQVDAQRALLAQRCEGSPRVSAEQVEWLARTLSVNPRSLTFERLGFDGTRCSMVIYHPRGVGKCSVDLAGRGVVQQIWRCDW